MLVVAQNKARGYIIIDYLRSWSFNFSSRLRAIVSSWLTVYFPFICVVLSLQILKTINMQTLWVGIFILVTKAMTAQSTNNTAPQAVYQKLEHALITDGKAGYCIQDTLFPTQGLSLDLIFIHVNVTVDSILPKSCSRHPPSPGTSTTFSYC